MPARRSKRRTSPHQTEYIKSPILRVGLVFFFIMVIIVVAYVVKVYTP